MKWIKWLVGLLAVIGVMFAMSQGRRALATAKRHEDLEREHNAVKGRIDKSVAKAETHRVKKVAALDKAKKQREAVEIRVAKLKETGHELTATEMADRANALF